MSGTIARVAVPRPIDDTFHYLIPDRLLRQIVPGSVVLVPLAASTVTGVVTDIVDQSPVQAKSIKALAEMDPLKEVDLELARWVASYYHSPLGLIMRLLLPPPVRSGTTRFRLTDGGRAALEEGGAPHGDLLRSLAKGPRTVSYLEKRHDRRLIDEAQESGLIEACFPVSPPPGAGVTGPAYSRDEQPVSDLTEHQDRALQAIEGHIESGGFSVSLIDGVAGSGKTEIYMRAARSVLDRGRGVLILVPEIALTPLLTSRISRIAPGGTAILHSSLPPAARKDAWDALASGRAKLAVGVRSAVFAPVTDLGLIIVDEEHDPSYRQEESPSYNARDVAVKRGQLEGIPVLLGSATPSLESFWNTETGRYSLVLLPERATPSPPPEIEVVNMADPGQRRPDDPFLSVRLLEELGRTVDRGEQSILFLNRRGFAPFLLCSECNNTLSCPNCSVTLTYHQDRGMLCHYCGHLQRPPDLCPSCGGRRIAPVGTGTQRLEDVLGSLLPGVNIERLDGDVMEKRGALETIYGRMDRGEIQILVGTQILAKGHDFPGVTLVGIINAEQALDLPDFRSAERVFQLITQVAGRAGRGSKRGKVLVQSYSPDHYAVSAALTGDYAAFYRAETEFRRTLGYPPFGRLGRVIVDGVSQERVQEACAAIAREASLSHGARVLGPAPAPLPRIRNRHRWHILFLAESRNRLNKAFLAARSQRAPGIRIHIRVDPYNLM
ncbi:MAG: primosomal protein N' [bacterium]|nr:MAG: primosomal protein N' [bacterium]